MTGGKEKQKNVRYLDCRDLLKLPCVSAVHHNCRPAVHAILLAWDPRKMAQVADHLMCESLSQGHEVENISLGHEVENIIRYGEIKNKTRGNTVNKINRYLGQSIMESAPISTLYML